MYHALYHGIWGYGSGNVDAFSLNLHDTVAILAKMVRNLSKRWAYPSLCHLATERTVTDWLHFRIGCIFCLQ
jgi:hypothetical protein